ncbi:hypothetical protein BURMUCF2_2145, partial [Burkholderia multivorans CF2]
MGMRTAHRCLHVCCRRRDAARRPCGRDCRRP